MDVALGFLPLVFISNLHCVVQINTCACCVRNARCSHLHLQFTIYNTVANARFKFLCFLSTRRNWFSPQTRFSAWMYPWHCSKACGKSTLRRQIRADQTNQSDALQVGKSTAQWVTNALLAEWNNCSCAFRASRYWCWCICSIGHCSELQVRHSKHLWQHTV